VRRHCRLTCSTVGIEDIEGVFQEAKKLVAGFL
jgi:hypothetical protein